VTVSKPRLEQPYAILVGQVVDTMLAGLKEWRPDLDYPEAHSDMVGCAYALIRRFDIKQRPLDIPLPVIPETPREA
jgi:hypothetical protein